MTTKKANLRNFFLFFLKYKISRSVNNKAMVHQNTIFKNYFSICWGFFFLEKWEFIGYSMHLYWRLKSLHFPWTAGCKLPRLYCSDELYLVSMKKKDPFAWKKILDPTSVSTSSSFSIKYQFQGNCPCCHGKTTGHCHFMLLHRTLTVWFDELF